MRNQSCTAFVYAIGTMDGHSVKIGHSVRVERRLAELRAASPVALELLWRTTGGRDLEQHLHRVFRERRRHAEWFDFREADACALIEAAANAFTASPEPPAARVPRLAPGVEKPVRPGIAGRRRAGPQQRSAERRRRP
ncbi:GIY-YIG nuclease family protein [Catenulispora subtropica]|uniref:GIY-YIG nuclease family protein n=1 Tax=Catenulispora subtropica TaxID=450798 RepID=UPI003CD0BA86